MRMGRGKRGLAALVGVLCAAPASAQVFGTLSWQMQPYCNVVTLTLTVTPAGFALDGHDDQCGASTRGSATGQVTLNPNGTAGVNFTTVTSPGGKGIHVSGVVSIGTGQGTWTDSVGNSGSFVLGGAVTGLPVRPVAASGLAPASVTTVEIAPGAIGAAQIDSSQVQTRIAASCLAGQVLRGINADGSVVCDSLPGYTEMSFAAELPLPGTTQEIGPLTFVAPASGFARLHGRGHCHFIPAAPSDVDAEISAGLNETAAFSGPLSRRARMRMVSNGDSSLGYSTEHRIPVVAGTSYSVAVYLRRTVGTIPDACYGTLTVTFATLLP